MKKPKFPVVSRVLMLIYLIGGSILCALPNLPAIAGGIDIAVWIIGYVGYVYVILACLYYAKKGK